MITYDIECTVAPFIEFGPRACELMRFFGMNLDGLRRRTLCHRLAVALSDGQICLLTGPSGAGLEVSSYINVDDTGARHAGKNGYCTHIGNKLFAWFESTPTKSRINFLELLRKGHRDYVINADALEYIQRQSFPRPLLALLATDSDKHFGTKEDWKRHLYQLAITKDRHVRIATEGALLGSVLHHGFSKELVILSDDAGRRCRDTFTSLKKTCRKLGLSFWDYLYGRVSKAGKITPLPEIIRARARSD